MILITLPHGHITGFRFRYVHIWMIWYF
ncbi:hypothetical protein RIR_e54490_A0A2N0NJI0_9GLOM [Rhizophagus irregularis DAOM 181602=DAOM 197198]|nr:hypothetical protein RIR_e54490_A0A2N0NJI0_9GLOM [Rhizophagus irregularis DAOM 181602=DAOM 197198]